LKGVLIMKNKINIKIIFAFITLIIASLLLLIILIHSNGSLPSWLPFQFSIIIGIILLSGTSFLCFIIKDFRSLLKYNIILIVILGLEMLLNFIGKTDFWKTNFPTDSFIGNFGGSILLKFLQIIPIILIMLIMYRSFKEFYLCKGNLSVKAEKIGWLGIEADRISWRKLSLISAICISLGTLLLTVLTVPNLSSISLAWSRFFKYLPIIILFAIVNSFCEGVLFRTTFLGTLKNALPKPYVIIIAAAFFGIAHYYGAPSGPIGVVMSAILGWYMCRSMYETKGFLSSWIIHSLQDLVIFSSMCLMGNFI